MALTINVPQGGQNAKAAPSGTGSGSGTARVICAVGTLDGSAPSGTTVKVNVYNGSLDPGNLPATPPSGALTIIPSGQAWQSSSVPVPASSATAPFPALTIVAWQIAPNGSVADIESVQFQGMNADNVDCGSGSGSGTGHSVAGLVAGAAVALAPAVWSLTLDSFLAPLGTSLNGTWLLALRGSTDQAGRWDNGGDGDEVPRIELTCGSPPSCDWRLVLRHRVFVAEYSAPPTWTAVGPLTLTAKKELLEPQTVTLVPA